MAQTSRARGEASAHDLQSTCIEAALRKLEYISADPAKIAQIFEWQFFPFGENVRMRREHQRSCRTK